MHLVVVIRSVILIKDRGILNLATAIRADNQHTIPVDDSCLHRLKLSHKTADF